MNKISKESFTLQCELMENHKRVVVADIIHRDEETKAKSSVLHILKCFNIILSAL